MQRLFSTFANGLPGVGLLLQRLVTGGVLIDFAILHLSGPHGHSMLLPMLIAICAGALLAVGLWTPVVGTTVAALLVLALVSGAFDPMISLLIAALGASLALIGPGAWSIDARIFGRKHISVPQRQDH
ncbi:MAG: hypothetical protein WBW84_19320 [Acidobacteriaceae bacterium]